MQMGVLLGVRLFLSCVLHASVAPREGRSQPQLPPALGSLGQRPLAGLS